MSETDKQLGMLKYGYVSRFADQFDIVAAAFRRDVAWSVPLANMRAGITEILVEKVLMSYNMFDVNTGALIPANECALQTWLNANTSFNRTPNVTDVEDKEYAMFMAGNQCQMYDVGILWTPHLNTFDMYFTASVVNAAGAGGTTVRWSCVLFGQIIK